MYICEKCDGRVFGNKGAFTYHKNACNQITDDDRERIKRLYSSGISLKKLRLKYGFSRTSVNLVIRNRRTHSAAGKIAHEKYADNFKHSVESKQKISLSRKEWLKKNKSKHNWRFKEETYPEKIFREWLETTNLKVVAEYTPDNFDRFYRIDFAIIDRNVAIEINGQQHYERDGSLRDYYQQRQDYIILKGWKVLNPQEKDIDINTYEIQGYTNDF